MLAGVINWLRRTFPQEAFESSWYKYLINQVGHLHLGMALAFWISIAWFGVFGEFPVRWMVWVVITAGYVWTEIVRGGDLWDGLEDSMFVCCYGAGGTFVVFAEIVPGNAKVVGDLSVAVLFMGGALAHLVVGVAERAFR